MIAVIGYGLAFLAVLAVAVGMFDAAQAGRRREIARDRRAAWEQRQRAATAPTRDRHPDL